MQVLQQGNAKHIGEIMNKFALLIAVLTAISGCNSKTDAAVSDAKLVISRTMKDPSSAIFRDVRAYPKGDQNVASPFMLICGYANGKNSFGAYAGESRFVVMRLGDKTLNPATEDTHREGKLKDIFEKQWEDCKE